MSGGRDRDEEALLSDEESPAELEEVAHRSSAGGDRSRSSEKTVPRARSGRCKVVCSYLVCSVMAVLVTAVLSMAVGLFVGQSLGRKAVHCEPPTVLVPDKVPWGDTATIGGRTQNVSDYFAEHVNEDDIKKYLL